jgi:hypothetical protein
MQALHDGPLIAATINDIERASPGTPNSVNSQPGPCRIHAQCPAPGERNMAVDGKSKLPSPDFVLFISVDTSHIRIEEHLARKCRERSGGTRSPKALVAALERLRRDGRR